MEYNKERRREGKQVTERERRRKSNRKEMTANIVSEGNKQKGKENR